MSVDTMSRSIIDSPRHTCKGHITFFSSKVSFHKANAHKTFVQEHLWFLERGCIFRISIWILTTIKNVKRWGWLPMKHCVSRYISDVSCRPQHDVEGDNFYVYKVTKMFVALIYCYLGRPRRNIIPEIAIEIGNLLVLAYLQKML